MAIDFVVNLPKDSKAHTKIYPKTKAALTWARHFLDSNIDRVHGDHYALPHHLALELSYAMKSDNLSVSYECLGTPKGAPRST